MRRNIASLFALQVATYALPLLLTPYLVRVLGPHHYGGIAFASAVVHYFVVLTDYGFNLSATRNAAILRDDPVAMSKLFSAVMIVKAALMGLGFLVLCLGLSLSGSDVDWRLYLAAYLVVLGHVALPTWLLQGLERMNTITRCVVSAQLVVVISVFVFVRESEDYRVAAGLQAAMPLIAAAICWPILRKTISLRPAWPGLAYLRQVVSEGQHVFVSTVAVSLYTATNTVVLGLFASASAVGYFSAADRLVKAVNGLVTPVAQVTFPYVARLKERSAASALAFLAKLLRWQGFGTLVLSLLLLVFAKPLVSVLFGAQFTESVLLVQLMALTPLLVGLSNVLGVQAMLNFGMSRALSRILIASGVINLALLFFLVNRFGVSGAAMSVLFTEAAVVAAMAGVLARNGMLSALIRNGSLR